MSAPAVASLSCPQCGAAIELRTLDQALSVVCSSCGSILDARDPNLALIQGFAGAAEIHAADPARHARHAQGRRSGRSSATRCAASRSTATSYYWDEYLLFNPYKGFRYLTQYDGHWNDVQVVRPRPRSRSAVGGRLVTLHGETFKHFQTATAETEFVLGEFPWQVRVGDAA